MNEQHEREHEHKHEIRVHIDRKQHTVHKEVMSGLELRERGGIPADHDLWEEVTGDHEDILIEDGKEVHLREDMHFYSCPKTINPGEK